MNELLHWFEQKTQREKILLFTALVFIVLFCILELVYFPLTNGIEQQKQQLQQNQRILQLLARAKPLLQEERPQDDSPQMIQAEALPELLEKNINTVGLKKYMKNFSQDAEKMVTIEFQHVPFDNLMKLSIQLWQKYQIKIATLSAKPTKPDGTADVNIKYMV